MLTLLYWVYLLPCFIDFHFPCMLFFLIRKFPSYHPQYKVNVWPVRCTQVIVFHHLQIYSGYRGEIQYFHLKSRKWIPVLNQLKFFFRPSSLHSGIWFVIRQKLTEKHSYHCLHWGHGWSSSFWPSYWQNRLKMDSRQVVPGDWDVHVLQHVYPSSYMILSSTFDEIKNYYF